VRACRGLKADHTPVWFMRQAGRYMPEYRKIREKHGIVEICKTPDLAAEVTLQPVRKLGVDAAIIFADLLLPLEPMGLPFEFTPGDGPRVERPVRTAADVEALSALHGSDLGYVGQAIAQVVSALDRQTPVIGFVGAPFTLASYMIEGGGSRHYTHVKRFMYSDREAWSRLLDKIVRTLTPFAALQAAAGAQAIQIFDSWAGALSPEDYAEYALPATQMLVRQLQTLGVPVIYFSTGTGGYLSLIQQTGADVISLDWRVRLGQAWDRLSGQPSVQGNLDPVALFAPLPEIRRRVEDVLSDVGRPGHIFNLGHGILPETPVDHVRAVVDLVHERTSATSAA